MRAYSMDLRERVLLDSDAGMKTARGVSTSIRRRVREIVECSGAASSRHSPRKPQSARESAVRHAIRKALP